MTRKNNSVFSFFIPVKPEQLYSEILYILVMLSSKACWDFSSTFWKWKEVRKGQYLRKGNEQAMGFPHSIGKGTAVQITPIVVNTGLMQDGINATAISLLGKLQQQQLESPNVGKAGFEQLQHPGAGSVQTKDKLSHILDKWRRGQQRCRSWIPKEQRESWQGPSRGCRMQSKKWNHSHFSKAWSNMEGFWLCGPMGAWGFYPI